jgi:5'-3' exonuclease
MAATAVGNNILAAPDERMDVIIVSGDRDLWPLLQYPRVRIFSLAHKSFIGEAHIQKAFDVKDPKFIPLCKALWGDSGDNVPNAVPRMQKPLLPVIQASDGSLMDFLEKTDSFPLSPRCVELLQGNLRQVVINEKLVRLNMSVPVEVLS